MSVAMTMMMLVAVMLYTRSRTLSPVITCHIPKDTIKEGFHSFSCA